MAESGIWFKGKFIRDGEGLYLETSMPFARAGLEGVSRTLKSNMHDAGVCLKEENNFDMAKKYRIRKLTPKECFRLMGVRDDDIDTILNSGVSNSQQYKMAGNSIVVDVLMGIFKQMLEPDDTTAEILPDEQQLSLFSDIDFC